LAKTQLGNNTGLEILANIMRHCDAKTNRHILGGLQKDLPQVVLELRRHILLFDDLAYADPRGLQRLLKIIRIRDLAVSLQGAPATVLKNIAANMSQRALSDLKDEITRLGKAREQEVDAARDRIMAVVAELIKSKELFLSRPSNDLIY